MEPISGKKIPNKTLGAIATVKQGLSSYYMRDGDEVVPLITLKDVQEGRIVSATVDRVPVKKTDRLDKSRLAIGDVVITIKGTNFRAAVVDESAAGFIISSNLIALSLSDKILPQVVAAYLNSPMGQRELESRAGGSNIMGLNTKSLLEVPIPIPPLEQQEALSRYLSSAREYEDVTKKELELRNVIKEAIIRRVME